MVANKPHIQLRFIEMPRGRRRWYARILWDRTLRNLRYRTPNYSDPARLFEHMSRRWKRLFTFESYDAQRRANHWPPTDD